MARNVGAPTRLSADAARRSFSFRFVGEAFSELRRVTWPNREETTRLTIMVIAVSAAVGVFLGLVDLIFSQLFDIVLGS
jgi:preprotein translocase subunit SecE